MFQYATGRAVALANRTELVCDLGWYHRTPKHNTPREFELFLYPIQAREATSHEEASGRNYTDRILRRVPLLPRPWRQFREKGYQFDASVREVIDNTYLDGYWQSYKYFDEIAGLLRTELTPSITPSELDMNILKQIKDSSAVSVHIRRGDYVTLKAAATVHGVCTLDYYRSALDVISSSVLDPHFFVFSDDSQWSRENLEFPGPVTFVDHNGPTTAFQDMRMMSTCRHHIIANSSFSWWGAWLNPGSDKIVVAPRKWFADGRPTNDLTPTAWHRI
jgi:hypothetical protein